MTNQSQNQLGATQYGLFGQSSQQVSGGPAFSLNGGTYPANCIGCGSRNRSTSYNVQQDVFHVTCFNCGGQFTAPGSSIATGQIQNSPGQVHQSVYQPSYIGPGGLAPPNPAVWQTGSVPSPFMATLPEPVKKLAPASFKLGEIVGWRGWRAWHNHLTALSQSVYWAPGEIMDGKPSEYGWEGIYAFKHLRQFLKYFELHTPVLYGQVALWGDVIEHELGYRAEHGKILSLVGGTSKDSRSRLKEFREIYKVGDQI